MEVLLPLTLLVAVILYAAFRAIRPPASMRQARIHIPITNNKTCLVENSTFQECDSYKVLYYKLHNLEKNPDTLPEARSHLLSFFAETLQCEKANRSTILELENFSDAALEQFLRLELNAVTTEWQGYVARRKAGSPRELLPTVADAKAWLVRITPLKFVDGAWLGHVHKITTPFALRQVTKSAWQVLSEELGDGDLKKCHTYVFDRLLQQVNLPAPAPDTREFMRHPGMDDVGVWRPAVAQLLISLFPQDFLPEILGFSLHFELLTMETLVAARELRELGLDPYYFTLHITIDNADTGHVAMASQTITAYLKLVEQLQGTAAVDQQWKRIQAGYILSKNINSGQSRTISEAQLLDIFRAKSTACDKIHDHCPARIQGRTIGAWLDPEAFSNPRWQVEFLQSLKQSKPWVLKGDSSRSRLVQQCAWGGCMFGAFTDREVITIRDWIDSLASPGPEIYVSFTGRTDVAQLSSNKPRFSSVTPNLHIAGLDSPNTNGICNAKKRLVIDAHTLNLHKLLPIWFAHASLLESVVSVPWAVTNPVGCAVVRLLRAQYGFLPEPMGVHGVEEMSRSDTIDLVNIGLEMIATIDPDRRLPLDIREVLEIWPSPFAEEMLALSSRPQELLWFLLGMTHAFVQLHEVLASASNLLFDKTRLAMDSVRKREEDSLAVCMAALNSDSPEYRDFVNGFALAAREIELCCT